MDELKKGDHALISQVKFVPSFGYYPVCVNVRTEYIYSLLITSFVGLFFFFAYNFIKTCTFPLAIYSLALVLDSIFVAFWIHQASFVWLVQSDITADTSIMISCPVMFFPHMLIFGMYLYCNLCVPVDLQFCYIIIFIYEYIYIHTIQISGSSSASSDGSNMYGTVNSNKLVNAWQYLTNFLCELSFFGYFN